MEVIDLNIGDKLYANYSGYELTLKDIKTEIVPDKKGKVKKISHYIFDSLSLGKDQSRSISILDGHSLYENLKGKNLQRERTCKAYNNRYEALL